MIESIVSYGLAVGAVYALIGITYNLMFSASRVFSFTAGMLGMLGGVSHGQKTSVGVAGEREFLEAEFGADGFEVGDLRSHFLGSVGSQAG